MRQPIKLPAENKYHNVHVMVGEYEFASRKEAKRYYELSLLLKAKEITNLVVHPAFELQGKFVDNEGNTQRAITYVADFSYSMTKRPSVTIVEDTKGVKTKDYLIKRKLFLKSYPNLVHREIT